MPPIAPMPPLEALTLAECRSSLRACLRSQLEQAISWLQMLAASAPSSVSPRGSGSAASSSSSTALAPRPLQQSLEGLSKGRTEGSEAQLRLLSQLSQADGEVRHHLSLATAGVRRTLGGAHAENIASSGSYAAGGGRNGSRGGCADSELQYEGESSIATLLPIGSTFMRPYLSLSTRKRLRVQHPEAAAAAAAEAAAKAKASAPTAAVTSATSSSSATGPYSVATSDTDNGVWMRLPLGAAGSCSAPRLVPGDVLHVPFTGAEATLLTQAMAARGIHPLPQQQDGQGQHGGECMPAWLGDEVRRCLPGRSAEDAWRFWNSSELASLVGPDSQPRTAASSAVAASSSSAASTSTANNAASSTAPAVPLEDRLWLLRHTSAEAAATCRAEPLSAPAASAAAAASGRGRSAASRGARQSEQPPPTYGFSPLSSGWKRPRGRPLPLLHSLTAYRSGLAVGQGCASYQARVWHALHCGYRANSISTKPTGHVVDVVFSPVPHPPAVAVASNLAPHEALLYNLSTSTNLVLGRGGPPNVVPPPAHDATVCCVRFTATGSKVLTASYDRTVRVWSAQDAHLLHVLGRPVMPAPPPDDAIPQNVQNDEGEGVEEAAEIGVAGSNETAAEAAVSGQAGIEGGEGGEHAGEGGGGLGGTAVVDGAPILAPWSYNGAIPGHTDHCICVAAHPMNDDLAASSGKDATILLWDLERGVALSKLSPSHDALDLAFGRQASSGSLFAAIDATTFASGHHGNGQMTMWDIETGTCVYALTQPRGHVSCLHCAVGGASVLVGAADGTVRQLASADGKEMFVYRSGMADVNLVSLSCSETYVQASGDRNLTHVLDIRRPDVPVHILAHDTPADGNYVNGVSAAWCHCSHATLITGSDDNLVRIWDVSRAEPEIARLQGHTSPVSCVAISQDDDLIASGGDEGRVVLYSRRALMGSSACQIGKENDIVLIRHARDDETKWNETIPKGSASS